MEANLNQLRNDYKAGKIVPFIGAGLSTPFKVPTWKELIENITVKYATGKLSFLKEAVNLHLERYDYWKAIDAIKDFAILEDQDIQTEIVKQINEKQIPIEDINLHNYVDIRDLDFNLHLTTNYEHLLHEYLNCSNIPIEMRAINFSTQDLFETKRVCHLHGHISNPGNIVISRESYEELYEDKKYDNLLKIVTGTRRLLFLGFSFDDQFIRTLIRDHKEYFQGNHYIILNNPSPEKIKELRKDYGLITIGYNAENSSHTEEIRKIFKQLSEDDEESSDLIESQTADKSEKESVIVGATISDMQQNVEDNLFYKKLVLEEVDVSLIELSTYFYIAAEIYIRQLITSGMNKEIINVILGKVFIKYKEKYFNSFKKYGNSQQFLEVVHESLEKIDFGRYAKLFNENVKSDEHENRGLIHVLANDVTKEIWWGEKRLNEKTKVEKNIGSAAID